MLQDFCAPHSWGRGNPERTSSRGTRLFGMRYNLLGNTGLYVSELCLGSMTFGGENSGMWQAIGRLGQQESLGLVSAALDAGVNFIDTADVYSEGESERLVGADLKSLK